MIKFNLQQPDLNKSARVELEKKMAELQALTILGRKCSDFLDNDLGEYLLQRAINEEDCAVREILAIDPQDATAIRECQLKAQVPNLLFAWLKEAIILGNNAEQQMMDEAH